MNPFPVQLIDGAWHVIITDDKSVPCKPQADAELLAQIPVQFELMRAKALHDPPDIKIIESIIKLGEEYSIINSMREFQHMKNWLKKRVA